MKSKKGMYFRLLAAFLRSRHRRGVSGVKRVPVSSFSHTPMVYGFRTGGPSYAFGRSTSFFFREWIRGLSSHAVVRILS